MKGADPSLKENLRSFFQLDDSIPFELLFSVETKNDPAFEIAQNLIAEYPLVRARIYLSSQSAHLYSPLGLNPKLKNLAQSYEHASYDLVLISDSNVRVKPSMLFDLTREFDEKTGLITSIVAGTEFKGLGGYLEAMYLNTFYARFNSLANAYAKPCVVGKSMLFRKSVAARFGGLKILSQFLAEDFMAGESMAKLGLRVKTAHQSVNQIIGTHSLNDFWSRHLRWGRIRKAHAPLAYLVEPFSNAWVISILGALALPTPLLPTLCSSLLFWMICDAVQFFALGRVKASQALGFPLVWMIREALAVPLWIRIGMANTVNWRGNRLQLARGGILVQD